MKRIRSSIGFHCGLVMLVLNPCAIPALAQETNAASTNQTATVTSPEADKAWRETQRATQPPMPPTDWSTRTVPLEEQSAYWVPLLDKAADKAKDFYTKYPNHPKAEEAKRIERNLLTMAAQKFQSTNHAEYLILLRKDAAKDPNTSEGERFALRMQEVETAAMGKKGEGQAAVFAELEKGARELLKEFPKRPEVYALLLEVASNSGGEKAKTLVAEIVASDAPERMKLEAKAMLKKLDALGKPLEIKYTAIDGRKVDIAALKGKVVLVDFWATWCGPCVAEVPDVKAAYAKLHDKGFEIVGISLDYDKAPLEKFVAKEKMAWPQFFDDSGSGNRIADEFGIHSIPTMWLVDKQGKLRDMNARGALEEKVSDLLKE